MLRMQQRQLLLLGGWFFLLLSGCGGGGGVRVVDAFSFSSTTAADVPTITSNPKESVQLLELLLQKENKQDQDDDDALAESLIQSLIGSKTKFDPTVCIDGGILWCTVYAKGGKKTPLWEKLSSGFSSNLKGQKYILGGEKEENVVVNYSEIFGNAFHLEAKGTFVEAATTTTTIPSTLETTAESTNGNPLESLWNSVFQSKPQQQSIKAATGSVSQCPCDYDVTVTGACIGLLGNKIEINGIQGKGIARLLYADPSLRIFVSPQTTQSPKVLGMTDEKWESAGLVTVQIRADLIDANWNDETKLLLL